jgi:hypothetical protein
MRILTTTLLILISSTAMAIEEPEYAVIEEYDDFELRFYDSYIVAEVDVDGDFEDSGNSAFRILAGYIFGDNAASEKMAMTAPVASQPAELTTYSFVMEKKYTMETLPAPNDERIRIREMPKRTMAVRQYSGRWTETKYEQNESALREALAAQGIQTVGGPVLARYNSPFSLPVLRRNEVMYEIIGKDSHRAAHEAHLND